MWLLNGTVTFNGPNAYQLRNSHSYLNDYYEEKEMYLKTESLIKFLFDWQCDKEKFYDCVLDLSEEMAKRDFWSKEEVVSIRHWLQDLNQIGYIEPTLKAKHFDKLRLSQSLNLNSSFIDDSFKVRYTPKFQQSIDFDNYCCQNESNSLDVLHEKVVSLKYLKNFCNLSNYTLIYVTAMKILITQKKSLCSGKCDGHLVASGRLQ
jgi:hypothetical protein